jgi:hypothetical protein
MMTTLHDKIVQIYPDLTSADFSLSGTICLQNDGDGKGDYIKLWNHPTHPQPTQEQLDAIS